MISKLCISNFRCFDDEITVRIRPITILIGKNNAGKSSIVKFLLMLKQTVQGLGENIYLFPNGSEVKLGGFNELKNRNTGKRNLQFRLQVSQTNSPGDSAMKFVSRYEQSRREHLLRNIVHEVEASVNYAKNLSHGKERISTLMDGSRVLSNKKNISGNISFLVAPEMFECDLKARLENDSVRYIAQSLSGLAHLSAARDELSIEVERYDPATGYVGKAGEKTLLELWKSRMTDNETTNQLLEKHIKNVLDIDELTINEGKQHIGFTARNINTKTTTGVARVGFGVSQCLPIFVQGLLMSPKTQLIVEQPEAQVHPTAQIEMGSFFVDLWNEREVGSIIETHSDNLILRIRHHVARGELNPDDVSIAYIAMNGNDNPTVCNLNINSDGTLQEGLPMEFFGQNIKEVFQEMQRPNSGKEHNAMQVSDEQ